MFSIRHFAEKIVAAGRDAINKKITADELQVIAKECATEIERVTLDHAGPYHVDSASEFTAEFVDKVRNGDS